MPLGGRWLSFALAFVVGVQIVGCRPTSPASGAHAEPPARLENTDVPDIKRVILTDKAAERLGITISPVVEQPIARTRVVGGEVITLDSGATLVRVHATPNDLTNIDRARTGLVQPLGPRNQTDRPAMVFGALATPARSTEPPAALAREDSSPSLYYALDSSQPVLNNGQRVLIELPLVGGQPIRKLVPYSALLYDLKGDTWTYTRIAPLTFVRHSVKLDYVNRDTAVLLDGPPAGTEVVSVGATELFGTEFKVGK